MKLLDSLPQEKLTAEEEDALARQIQKVKGTNQDTVNKLVLHNMQEAFLYAKGVCRAKMADDEIFSLCYTTLYRNAKRFRPGMIRFFAFTKVAIRGAISRYWRTLDVVKNSSLHETEEIYVAPRKAKGEFWDDTNSELNDWEEKLPELACPSIQDDPITDPEYDAIETREQMIFVTEAMKRRLTEQERMVLDLCYKDGFSFQEIGDLLEITRSAVLLAHSKSLKKIRAELSKQRRLLVVK